MITYDASHWLSPPLLSPPLYWGVVSLWCLFTLLASSVPVSLMERTLLDYQSQAEDLKQAKREAQDRLRQFEAVFDQAFQLMGLLSADGKILKANATALRFAGVSQEEVLGMSFADSPWWYEEDRPQVRDAIHQARQGHTVRFRCRHRDKSSQERIIDFSLSPFRDSQGQVVYLIPEGRDITEWEVAQARMRQAQKAESLGMLASGVAHDVKNMLTTTMFASSLLEEHFQKTNNTEGLTYLAHIKTASNSSADLVANLLRYARRAPIRKKTVDLNDVATVAFNLLSVNLVKNVMADFKPHAKPLLLTADVSALEQAIVNLGLNAKDAMPAGGTFSLSLTSVALNGTEPELRDFQYSPGLYAVLRAQDTGHGMDAATLTRIFEPFFTTKNDKGTGLGLPGVLAAVREHGGAMQVKSTVGVGTEFIMYLPLANSET